MTHDYKQDFPIFQHTNVAYIDNAATAQRPQCVLDAVAAGRFHIYTAEHVSDGIAELTGQSVHAAPTGVNRVLELAEQTLRDFRRACQVAGHTRLRFPSRSRPNSTAAPTKKP